MRADNWYANVDPIVRDAMNLSSGTMASLTGHRDYKTLDAIQHEFTEFCEETAGKWETWIHAWKSYQEATQTTANR